MKNKPDTAVPEDEHAPERFGPEAFETPRMAVERLPAPRLRVWLLKPVDPQEPPFHFATMPTVFVVAAESENMARAFVSHDAGEVWCDGTKTECAELMPREAGIVARDMG